MTTMHAPSPWYYRIPVFGWIARDLNREEDSIWYLLVAILSLWAIAVMTWGLPALYLPAVMAAPVCLLLLVLVSLG
ncbi:hypothetical protein ACFQXB_07015 [Plastorhodobacter daqingensis]|uniref:DUF4175 domain-containing protein n=1 Tax=Plastorhodobacter daqingensis TaxID=1387281 RepID=A0ABW2UGY9_9RHOB